MSADKQVGLIEVKAKGHKFYTYRELVRKFNNDLAKKLCSAIYKKDIEQIILLLSENTVKDPKNDFKYIVKGSPSISVDDLIAYFSPDGTGLIGGNLTPLQWACTMGAVEIVELLLKFGFDPNHVAIVNKKSALDCACQNKQYRAVKKLLQYGANPNYRDQSTREHPLLTACYSENVELVELLLMNGADVNALGRFGNTPLFIACMKNNLELVGKLMMYHADSTSIIRENSSDTPTVLHWLCKYNQTELLKFVLSAKPNVNISDAKKGIQPIHYAAQYGSVDLVKQLLSTGANPNAKDKWGMAPLFYACRNEYPEQTGENSSIDIVKQLLSAGANPNVKDKSGTMPLSYACSYNKPELFDLFFTTEAIAHIPMSLFDLPLLCHAAHTNDFMSLAIKLISAGHDVNVRDNDEGRTPLYFAARNGMLEMVKFLIAQKADVTISDKEGNTPLHVAVKNHHDQTIKYLLNYTEIDINALNTEGVSVLYDVLHARCQYRINNTHRIMLLLSHSGINVNLGTHKLLDMVLNHINDNEFPDGVWGTPLSMVEREKIAIMLLLRGAVISDTNLKHPIIQKWLVYKKHVANLKEKQLNNKYRTFLSAKIGLLKNRCIHSVVSNQVPTKGIPEPLMRVTNELYDAFDDYQKWSSTYVHKELKASASSKAMKKLR